LIYILFAYILFFSHLTRESTGGQRKIRSRPGPGDGSLDFFSAKQSGGRPVIASENVIERLTNEEKELMYLVD
jgi:hypothetical protein